MEVRLMTKFGLVADIGGTNARFALVELGGSLAHSWRCGVNEYRSLAEATEAYLSRTCVDRPARAALAVAAPITGDQVTLTNHPWSFSIDALRKELGLEDLRVINDFVANALSIPHLDEASRKQIGAGSPVAGCPIGVIGPGSGLGVSGLIPTKDGVTPIEGEGGHVTLAPYDARESAVINHLRERYEHVSAERLLSGPGLVNIYEALCALSEAPGSSYAPAQIADPAIWGVDPCTEQAVALFCAMLGGAAGNLALTLGARGGVYIAGGIAPQMLTYLERSQFRTRFASKGRFHGYLDKIPTYVITHPTPALIGAGALLS